MLEIVLQLKKLFQVKSKVFQVKSNPFIFCVNFHNFKI